IVELGLECTQLVVGLLGLESPLLAALGEVGHLVLELLEGGLEGLMLALPKVPALAVEPNQRARSAPAVLGCPLWSPSRRLAGKGSVHACLLLPHPWEHPKLAPAQQKKQNLARSNWQSRSTFHGARVTPPPRKTRFRILAKFFRAGFVNPQGCMKSFRVRVSSPFLELA